MQIKNLYKLFINECTGISTDTRNITPGSIFFALKGKRFDGNKFASQAIEKGAAYAVIDDADFKTTDKCIRTSDTLQTLQGLAKFHIGQLKPKLKVIGLTGSNGKTTTKELISIVLGKKYNVGFTKGNLNNHIGVPLTILSLKKQHEVAVIEMGANHMGEIGNLSHIAIPDYGLITNIGKAHLEGFGSVENIVKGKTELFDYLEKNNGTCFINANSYQLLHKASTLKCNKIYYGNHAQSYVNTEITNNVSPFLKITYLDNQHNLQIRSQLIGDYNLDNINAAIAIGKFFNVEIKKIKQAIEEYVPTNNRSQLIQKNGNTIVLDAYNANPSSMEAAIRNFIKRNRKNKTVILGEMNELGEYSLEAHKKIVDLVLGKNLKVLLVGKGFESFHQNSGIFYFEDTYKLIEWIKFNRILDADILIKGSRSNQLEKIIEYL